MATAKNGPVKPPVIDIKAKKTVSKPGVAKNAPLSKTPPAASAKPAGKSARDAAGSATGQNKQPVTGKTAAKGKTSRPSSTSSSSGAPSDIHSGVPLRRSFGWAALAGTLGGALLAIIIMLALLLSGILQPLVSPAKSPEFAALSERVGVNLEQITEGLVGYAALDDKVSALDKQVGAFGSRLDQQSKQLQGQIDGLNKRLGDMTGQYQGLSENFANLKIPAYTPFDPAPLESKIALLGARIDAIAAGASTGDAQKLSADLAAIKNQFATQSQQLIALKDQLAGINQPLARVNAQLDEARKTLSQNQLQISQNASAVSALSAKLAALPSPPDRQNISPKALQLPLALIGIQTALEQGRPFAVELASLASTLPDLKIAQNLPEIAKSGLLRPDQLLVRFERKLPAMLAARPTSPNAGWQQALLERLKSLVALRPSEQDGLTGIDALIVETENAVKRRDFAAAATAIGQMPAPMQTALGELDQQIADMGAIETLLSEARIKALSQGAKTGADQ